MFSYSINIKDLSINEKEIPHEKIKKSINLVSSVLNIKQKLFFDISFIDEDEIKTINKNYRNVDKPTDVLSFAFWDSKSSIKTNLIGEIFICYQYSIKNKYKENFTNEEEIVYMVVHGLLHLLGYDHDTEEKEKIMFDLQDKIFLKI